MPYPTKPPHLKSITGSKKPVVKGVDVPVLAEVPAAPDWLPNSHALNEWNRLSAFLVANRMMTEGGLSGLGVLCALHGKLVQLWSAGECPTGHMLAQYRSLINDFGLTPIAQGKVKQVGEREQGNAFARNGRPAVAA